MSSNYEPANHPIHSTAWIGFTQASFGLAVLASGLGIWFIDADIAAKGYLAMGLLLVITTSINLSKTIRDQHEANRITSRVEDAKVTKFLMEHDPMAA